MFLSSKRKKLIMPQPYLLISEATSKGPLFAAVVERKLLGRLIGVRTETSMEGVRHFFWVADLGNASVKSTY